MPIVRISPNRHVVHRFPGPPLPNPVQIVVVSDVPVEVYLTNPAGVMIFRSGGLPPYIAASAGPIMDFRHIFYPQPLAEWCVLIVNRTNQEAAVFTEATW